MESEDGRREKTKAGIFDPLAMMPLALIIAVTSGIGFATLIVGKRRISQLRFIEEKEGHPLRD